MQNPTGPNSDPAGEERRGEVFVSGRLQKTGGIVEWSACLPRRKTLL
jgi:hypothetical protein